VVEGAPALNRVSWTPSGLHVTVGDDMGKIWVYDVGEVSYVRCRKTQNSSLEEMLCVVLLLTVCFTGSRF
jgi:hypothetical protein